MSSSSSAISLPLLGKGFSLKRPHLSFATSVQLGIATMSSLHLVLWRPLFSILVGHWVIKRANLTGHWPSYLLHAQPIYITSPFVVHWEAWTSLLVHCLLFSGRSQHVPFHFDLSDSNLIVSHDS